MPERRTVLMPITFYPSLGDKLLTLRVHESLSRDTPLIAQLVIKVLEAHGYVAGEYAVIIADKRTAAIIKDRLVRDVLPAGPVH